MFHHPVVWISKLLFNYSQHFPSYKKQSNLGGSWVTACSFLVQRESRICKRNIERNVSKHSLHICHLLEHVFCHIKIQSLSSIAHSRNLNGRNKFKTDKTSLCSGHQEGSSSCVYKRVNSKHWKFHWGIGWRLVLSRMLLHCARIGRFLAYQPEPFKLCKSQKYVAERTVLSCTWLPPALMLALHLRLQVKGNSLLSIGSRVKTVNRFPVPAAL